MKFIITIIYKIQVRDFIKKDERFPGVHERRI